VTIPRDIPEKELSGDKRRNIFLCVKETLNNMLKHSGATGLTIDILTDGVLTIRIHDNGKVLIFRKFASLEMVCKISNEGWKVSGEILKLKITTEQRQY
jgi:glucose-6-phosphate-specific signal transduction histidine kinase